MPSTIFHHWLDQFHALPAPQRRRLRRMLWGFAAVVVLLLGIAIGRGLGLPNGLESRARRLVTQNTSLQDQVQGLQRQQRTNATALAALKSTLAERDAALQKLKREQAFYAKLIGIDGDRSGLGVHSIALTPVTGTHAWNFVATLVNTAEHADAARGTLTLAVEGVRGGKLSTLEWPALAGPKAAEGVPFAFKFFQQVSGSFMLPQGFVPNRIVVTLHAKSAAAVTRTLDWKQAQASQRGSTLATP